MLRRPSNILVLLLVFALGGWLTYRFFVPKSHPIEKSDVLLEKIHEVFKLVTVEGQFSEVYNYSEYQGYFTWLYDKRVLVRVRATVSAGYDLSNLQMDVDSVHHVLRFGPLPEPQILAIDHTLDYYDISTGFFTSFSPEDYNRINQRAKDLIRDQALKSDLLPSARRQAAKVFDLVQFMGENAGWKVEFGEEEKIEN